MASSQSHQHGRLRRPSSLMAPSSSKQPNLDYSVATVPPPQNPSTSGNADGNKNQILSAAPTTAAPEDVFLSKSSHLTRHEVLRRRSHNLKQLARVYKDQYWAMMEELKGQYREYLWKYGLSPFKEDDEEEIAKEREKEEVNKNTPSPCAFHGCMLKAMPLTRFCHLHILSDPKQLLYKPCEYVIKSSQAGPITCGRPILRARVPALCNVHLQKSYRALKKAGLHISSSSKLAPKFHVIVAEYVRQIQAKRRAALRAHSNNVVVKQESCN